MLFRYVILGSLVTVKAVRASINVSNISYKSCTLLCYVKKEKYMYLLSPKKKKILSGLLHLGAQIRCAQN